MSKALMKALKDKLATWEFLSACVVFLFLSGGFYVKINMQVAQAQEQLVGLEGRVLDIYDIKSDIRDINTRQESFEEKIMLKFEYQENSLGEIKDILKAGH